MPRTIPFKQHREKLLREGATAGVLPAGQATLTDRVSVLDTFEEDWASPNGGTGTYHEKANRHDHHKVLHEASKRGHRKGQEASNGSRDPDSDEAMADE